ncbi:receptor-like protein kinase 1 [Hibiscus trionum]|uniref:Receptor-like protein kinase 1 n=1 Tax=Hibiscus trionum TaxID=183268 RepID=A0A9W7H356_HIBTR|nr:receptor-like protein kinase 1 [Hibiscus trionum]
MIDQTHTKTDIRGTKGYVAPEWFRNMPVTAKVDVYSFGVLLLEIICCRRSVAAETDGDSSSILTYWAYDCFIEGTIDALIGDDMEAIHDRKRLEMLLMTALWCIQEDPCLRPNMRKVAQMLEGVVQVTIPPNPSPFTISVP